jgi:hypothetical protein
MNMKKYFKITILMLTVGLCFSCSDDDDSITTGSYIPKEVTISDWGTADKPATWGNEIVVTGDGFSASTELYLRPAESNIDPDKGISLEIVDRTAGSIKFLAPLAGGNSEYELLQVEGDLVYSLGTIYLKDEKFPSRLVGPVNNNEWGVSASYMDFKYERGKLMEIKEFSTSDQFGTSEGNCYTFIYDGDRISSLVKTQMGDLVVKTYTFEYKGNTVLVKSDDGSIRNMTLTLNNDGVMTGRTEKWEQTNPIFDEDTWEIIGEYTDYYKDVYAYTYDTQGNMSGYTVQNLMNGDQISDSYMRFQYDSKHTFLPHILPAWFWAITYTDVFNYMVGYTNNVVGYTVPGGGGPFARADEVTISYELEYDKDEYPTYIYTLNEMFDGSIEKFKLYDVVYN